MKPGQSVRIKRTGRETTVQVVETWDNGEISAVFVGNSSDMETWIKFDSSELEPSAHKPRSLEQILSVEFRLMQPTAYYISVDLKRLIDAGWVWRRMSLHGYWIIGFTQMGHAAAEMCGLYDEIRGDWLAELETDYEAYRKQQEREHWANIEHAGDEAELQQWIDEHGVEPGGICPDCGRTDAGCTCDAL